MYSASGTYASAISRGAQRRSRCLAMHSALFTEVLRRGILRSPYPESCIAPVLTAHDPFTRPPCWTGAIHIIVVVHIYAPCLIGHAVSSRRAHGLATRDPRQDRGVGAPTPPAGGGEAPRQKARRSRGRASGGGAQGQTAGDQPQHRRPAGFPGVVQQEERIVQGRMGRTAALRSGSQDELPRRQICGTWLS